MGPLSQPLFDFYALALPRGHGFGGATPIGAQGSDDGYGRKQPLARGSYRPETALQ